MAFMTRLAVSSATGPVWLITRLTVAVETPAICATSSILERGHIGTSFVFMIKQMRLFTHDLTRSEISILTRIYRDIPARIWRFERGLNFFDAMKKQAQM